MTIQMTGSQSAGQMIVSTNYTSENNNRAIQHAFHNNRGSASSRLQQQHTQQRVAEREREQRIRETEDERIQILSDKIALVAADQDLDYEQRRVRVSMLTNQIKQIHVARAEREELAAEREVLRQQQLLAERQREQEELAEEQRANNVANTGSEEELQQLQASESIRNLTMMSARIDHISALNTTRTRLEAEANHLEQAIRDDEGFVVIRTPRGHSHDVTTITVPTGHEGDDFRQSQLSRLNEGISRLEVAVAQQVGSLYRDGQVMQEAQLRYMRDGAKPVTDEEEREKEHEYAYKPVIDARL